MPDSAAATLPRFAGLAVVAGMAVFYELMGCLTLFAAMLVLWREEQRLKAAP